MKFTVQETLVQGRPALLLRIEHNDQGTEWSLKEFDRKYFAESMQCFKYIEAYLATLSPAINDKIWAVYQEAQKVLYNTPDLIVLGQRMTNLVGKLYEDINLDSLEKWLGFNPEFRVPSRYSLQYVQKDDRPSSLEQTYLRHDYIKLVTLSVAIRLVTPIWSEFLQSTHKEIGTLRKEEYAFGLLNKTKLLHCEAMERLRSYIKANYKTDRPMISSILEGISAMDYLEWVLTTVVVNRVAVGDIRGNDDTACLVITIHGYVRSLLDSNQNSSQFGHVVREKIFRDSGNDSQGPSRLEEYRIADKLTPGDEVIHDFYLKDIHRAADTLYPGIDHALLEKFLQHNLAQPSRIFYKGQLNLMGWVLDPIVPARACMHLERYALHGISLAQTVLWQKGKIKLAALLTASVPTTDNNNMFISAGGDINSRILKEQTEALAALFPFTVVCANRPKAKQVNDGVTAIVAMSEHFQRYDWTLTLPDDLVPVVSRGTSSRRFPCPPDIKILLADLVIDVATGQWLQN